MPIISTIGRKHWKVRLLFLGMYIFLVLGAISMVYPFLLMITGSTYSRCDTRYFKAAPLFLTDENWLYRKYVEGVLNEDIFTLNMVYNNPYTLVEQISIPSNINVKMVDAWKSFLKENTLPSYSWQLGFIYTPYSRTMPENLRGLLQFWQKNISRDIDKVNQQLGTKFMNWTTININIMEALMRRFKPTDLPLYKSIAEYAETVPIEHRYYSSVEGFYKWQYLKALYPSIQDYNTAHKTKHIRYEDLRLPEKYSDISNAKEKQDWERFIRETVGTQWLRVDSNAITSYCAFLKLKYDNKISDLNKYYASSYKSFDEIPLLDEPPLKGVKASDWEMFITGWQDPETKTSCKAPIESISIHSTEFMFRKWLTSKYGSIEKINAELNTSFKNSLDIIPPQQEAQYLWFAQNKKHVKWEFIKRNYITVINNILLHGRGVSNTAIYCVLAVVSALLVNPLAAYALSRYKMPSAYKILLFLMATMAFPPMVTGIQNFLMLKRLNLLNTFGALILPGLANGYSIFLLKGFFDSQPRELYESASLDGAGEWTIFWHIAMSLSKPILAVIALNAFVGAYSNFMFAFITCQDEKMWTLMVWLYQLQQRAGAGVMYASLIIAAIPTLLVFVFCQNIIMRGIVVPSEK
jgi:multiple sugar transport system permease protein